MSGSLYIWWYNLREHKKELFVAHKIEHIVVFLQLEPDRMVQSVCPKAYVYSICFYLNLCMNTHLKFQNEIIFKYLVLVSDFNMQQHGCQEECFYCNAVCFCVRQVLSEPL